ncbi:MAG: hypothetical protein Q8R61_01835 [Thiobacillus sp.]|uniref:hypothetical protein n=1 Tax=Thiobacillus sp. TaxID=924 RepID=UPI0027363244|nr:hypothetical protein [Thiobacillus sp.]MDP3583838.1 hypothetical protein [Thiobacillus sp.]
MKIGHIAWPLLGIAGMAMAQGDYSTTAPAAAVVQEPTPQQVVVRTSTRPLKETGPDLRRCLELKTQAAIIRCAETGRRR